MILYNLLSDEESNKRIDDWLIVGAERDFFVVSSMKITHRLSELMSDCKLFFPLSS